MSRHQVILSMSRRSLCCSPDFRFHTAGLCDHLSSSFLSACYVSLLLYTLSSRHVSSCDVKGVQLGCERRFNIEFCGADPHFCHYAYVTWSRVELWSAHVPARLWNFCCRTHFVRHDIRVERSSDVTSCFQKWRKCLLKKYANGPLYMTPSHQIIEISIWEPTHEKG